MPSNIKLASWLLRIGLAATFIYAGLGALIHPSHWLGYLPNAATSHINANTLLKITAIFELALAAFLLSGWRTKWAAGLAMLTIAGIFVGNLNALEITFRDISIFFAAAALVCLPE